MATKKKQIEAEAAVDEGAEGEAAPAKVRKLPLKLIVIAATALLILGGGGTAAYFILGAKNASQATAAAQPKPPVFLDLPDTLVNLA
ncbi:MAG: hypothetical protein K8H87_07385, partial [Pseudorhodoplanes sp.]|nr:hypothetical protein [Pseudorhodoplanes sp.]